MNFNTKYYAAQVNINLIHRWCTKLKTNTNNQKPTFYYSNNNKKIEECQHADM